MTDGPNPIESPAPPSPRPVRRRATFVILAGVLAIVGALAAGYYFAMRPVTLRIAVGPANSDDLRVVQALTQALQQPATRPGPAAPDARPMAPPRAPRCSAKARPISPSSAAISKCRKTRRPWRRCARTSRCCGCLPPAKVKGKKAAPKITKIAQLAGHRIGVVGRTPANVNLLKVILQQYGVDPAKVEIIQFPANEAADAIRNQKADAYLAAGPVNSKITADAIAASTRDGGTPKFLAIDLAEAIAQNHPAYEASEIPAGTFGGAPGKPEEEVKTISFSHHIVARKGVSEATIAAFTRQLFAIRQSLKTEFPLAAKIETPDTDKDATIPVHPGAAAFVDGEEKTFLDRYSDFIWWGLMAIVGDGLRRRVVCGLSQERRAQRQHLAARAAAGHAHRRAPLATRPTNSTRCRRKPTTSCATRCDASSMARSRKAR